jgi:hypothetical protein
VTLPTTALNGRLVKTLSSPIAGTLRFAAMPGLWKVMMAVLVVCLLASIVIGAVRLATTPTEILGDNFQGWPGKRFPR